MTRETVAVETPARSATWRIVRRLLRPFSGRIVELIRRIESYFSETLQRLPPSRSATYIGKSLNTTLDRREIVPVAFSVAARVGSGEATRGTGEERHEMWFITRRLTFYVVAAWVAITVNF